jgi:iron complex transport system ATP-binding protein
MVNVEIERVCFSYPGADILHDVTFCIGPGEMTGLIGPNGSGKSTLIKCIDTILKPKGSILLNGKDVLKMDQVDLAKNIGLVPQHGTSAMDSTVFETVLMGRRPHSAWQIRDEDIDKVADTLDRLNIGIWQCGISQVCPAAKNRWFSSLGQSVRNLRCCF